ncbi:MAG: ATP-binding protein [Fibrobacterota bacterium]
MYSRILNYPDDKSFFLFGPRGTGKTTWVKSRFPDAVYIDLLESEIFNDLIANPQRLELFIPESYNGFIIIDEVQRIPELLNEVHRLIEKNGYKFILTGSSARKVRSSGQNLLGGRALTRSFHPLTCFELKESFSLNHSLQFGNLPCAYTEKDPKSYLESYVNTYLEEEIRQEGLTRNLGGFARFLESASFSQGAVLNISAVARDCGIHRKVVEHYFLILEELLIAYRIPVFSKKAKRRLSKHPKFYFFDVGVFRTVRPMGPLDSPEKAEGVAFESLFLQELIAVNNTMNLGYRIYYWQTSNNIEVDFVLYGNKGFLAFELKRTAKVNNRHLSGLKSFMRDYPMAKPFCIYGGTRRLYDGKIEILPVEYALRHLGEILEFLKSD